MGKNIVWLSQFELMQDDKDIGPCKTIGGAEITIDYHVKYLISKGNKVEVMTPATLDMDKVKKSDLVVLSNIIFGYVNTDGQWYTNNQYDKNPTLFQLDDLDWIIKNKDYVNVEHDLKWHWRRNETVDGFPDTSLYKPTWWGNMMSNAKLNVFLSPLQVMPTLRYFFKYMATDKYKNATLKEIRNWEKEWHLHWRSCAKDNIICIPPPVKKEVWFPSKSAVIKGTYAVIGAIYPGKGIEDILLQFKELGNKLRFIGKVSDQLLANKIIKEGHTIVPPVQYKDMPKLIQKYQYVIISRRVPKSNKYPDGTIEYYTDIKGNVIYDYMNEGFGRIIPEVLNVGCKILVDEGSKKHIGAYGYNWTDQEIIDNCQIADKLFYDTLIERKIL